MLGAPVCRYHCLRGHRAALLLRQVNDKLSKDTLLHFPKTQRINAPTAVELEYGAYIILILKTDHQFNTSV